MVTIDGFVIDLATAEEHAYEADVTDYPVEVGSNVTDNVRPRPVIVTIDGLVTDSPLDDVAPLRDPGQLPSEAARAKLEQVFNDREPVPVADSLRVWDSMVMQSLSFPRNAQTGHSLRFKAAFKQVRLITNTRTTVQVAVPRAAHRTNRGNKIGATKVPGDAKSGSGDLLSPFKAVFQLGEDAADKLVD